MIVVDSSVWIDLFEANATPQAVFLREILGVSEVGIPDLALTEVLQGTRSDRAFANAHRILRSMFLIETVGSAVAVQAARNYRHLRSFGITVRKTIDTLIATRCIMDGHELLHNDRDFDPFAEHLGLVVCRQD